MIPLVLAVSLACATSATNAPRVLVLDVKATTMDAASVTAFTKLVTHELAIALAPMSVVDVHEVARLADLEADRQDAGCTTTSCLAEVAGAYGAELVLFGEEAVLGDKHVVTLQIFDAKRAQARGRTLITVEHVGDLPEHVPGAVRDLVSSLPRPATAATPATPATAPAPAAATVDGQGVGGVGSATSIDDGASVLATAGYVTAGGIATLGAIGLLAGAVVLTTPTDPDGAPLGFGLFGAGVGLLLVGAPLVAGGTWLLCDQPSRGGAP